jgi:c-di-GMP-binding flagellar brake protein YcgR
MSHTGASSTFLTHEVVQICFRTQEHSTAGEMVVSGEVAAAGSKTLKISLDSAVQSCPKPFSDSGRCVIRKRTSRGMLEFDATAEGQSSTDGEFTLTVVIAGTPRHLQRRGFCRFIVSSNARYRMLEVIGDESWHPAELHDVSLGGASLLLPAHALCIGRRIIVEFTLDEQGFSLTAVVRRIENKHNHGLRLYALEYVELDNRQQRRMSKAIAKLQQRLIRSQIKID